MLLHRWSLGLRAIAVFEIFKGGAVLIAFFMVAAGRWTMASLMERITHYMHVRPEGRIGQFLNGTIVHLEPGVLAWLAIAYMAVRFAEAYGLWKERHWGEWLAVFSAGLYVPAEIYELLRHFSYRKAGVLIVNIAIIIFLVWVLWKTRRARAGEREG